MRADQILAARKSADSLCKSMNISDGEKYMIFGDINTKEDINKVKLLGVLYQYLRFIYTDINDIGRYIRFTNFSDDVGGVRILDILIHGDTIDVWNSLAYHCEIKKEIDSIILTEPPSTESEIPSSSSQL